MTEPGVDPNEGIVGPSPSKRRLPIAGLLLGAAVAVGVLGWAVTRSPLKAPPPHATPAAADTSDEHISTARQTASRRLSSFAVAATTVQPFASEPATLETFDPPLSLSPPFEVIDSAIFDNGERRIRLARLRPLGRTEVCTDDRQLRFACGLMARAFLIRMLNRGEVTCRRLYMTAAPQNDRVDADCHGADGNFSELLVRNGFALPSSPMDENLAAAASEARRNKAGIWAGPYAVSAADHARRDEEAFPPGSTRSRANFVPDAVETPAPAGHSPERSSPQ